MKGDTHINECDDQRTLTVKTAFAVAVLIFCLGAAMLSAWLIPKVDSWAFYLYGIGCGAVIALKTDIRYYTWPVILGAAGSLVVTFIVFWNYEIPWLRTVLVLASTVIIAVWARNILNGFRDSYVRNRRAIEAAAKERETERRRKALKNP